MDFKNIDKKYRPIPFWSWNEELSVEQTRRQVRIMDEAGIGGYFMHARGGLTTEYMGEDWFANVDAATDEGAKRGMHSFAYDENGWPSGFGGGRVNGLGVEYQQKSLHVEPYDSEKENENTVLIRDGRRYYYNVNQFYVDVLNKDVIAKFIDEIYCEYKDRCGDKIEGFFTDEPQILRDSGYPWSFILEDRFSEKYGYSLIDNLDSLFLELENSKRVRVDYWMLVTELFSDAFCKQIYDWCESNGYKFTGHLVLEETLFSQLVSNGACMPHYEYFSIPGMDWLCRVIYDCLTPMQVSSASAQTGKKQVLSETFALCGHNVSHNELKAIYEWQMVHGINLLCTHLEGYSTRGIRKRDYPPAMYYQQPWWDDVNIFFDSMSRVGKLLTEGEICADVLLIHPETTAWIMYDGCEGDKKTQAAIDDLNKSFMADMRTLEDKHTLYHLGDETLIGRHGSVENGVFRIGNMSYTTVVLPTEYIDFFPHTKELIARFKEQGGRVVSASEIERNPILPENRLSYTKRVLDEFDMHYFVNTNDFSISCEIDVDGRVLDILNCETYAFSGKHSFAPYESLVVLDYHEGKQVEEESDRDELSLLGKWDVENATLNSITLDKCDYYFDGELVERDGYVLNILPRLNALKRRVNLRQIYRFECDVIPSELYIATETPEIFEIKVNGEKIDKTDFGCFRDISIRMLNILPHVRVGENTVEFTSDIEQGPKCREHLDNSWGFETMKNCLWYDMEIEPVYLLGDFGAEHTSEICELPMQAYRVSSIPKITAKPTEVDIHDLDLSGYPEFAGRLTLSRNVTVDDTNKYVVLQGRGMNSIAIYVNGEYVATRMFAPHTVDLSSVLKKGENRITLVILNNLRNLMGPHHTKAGELYLVTPGSFYKESNVFAHPKGKGEDCHDVLSHWNEDYCLVHFGLGDCEEHIPSNLSW